jgi:hypothetical protein
MRAKRHRPARQCASTCVHSASLTTHRQPSLQPPDDTVHFPIGVRWHQHGSPRGREGSGDHEL